jgi:hypothetical protein
LPPEAQGPATDLGVIEITALRDSQGQPLISDFVSSTKETPGTSQTETTTTYSPTTVSGLSPQATQVLGIGSTPSVYQASGATTGLTSDRGAGEIESQETGGKRKDVWNEESLRLKDALGL